MYGGNNVIGNLMLRQFTPNRFLSNFNGIFLYSQSVLLIFHVNVMTYFIKTIITPIFHAHTHTTYVCATVGIVTFLRGS